MKVFIALALLFLSFSDGKAVPLDGTVVSTNKVPNPLPPAKSVIVNVTSTFSSGVDITNVVVAVTNLKASQYAAVGFSQNQSMVNIKE